MNVVLTTILAFFQDFFKSLIELNSTRNFFSLIGVIFFRWVFSFFYTIRSFFQGSSYLKFFLKEFICLFLFPYIFFIYNFIKLLLIFLNILLNFFVILLLSLFEYFNISVFLKKTLIWFHEITSSIYFKKDILYLSSFDFVVIWLYFIFVVVLYDKYFKPILIKYITL